MFSLACFGQNHSSWQHCLGSKKKSQHKGGTYWYRVFIVPRACGGRHTRTLAKRFPPPTRLITVTPVTRTERAPGSSKNLQYQLRWQLTKEATHTPWYANRQSARETFRTFVLNLFSAANVIPHYCHVDCLQQSGGSGKGANLNAIARGQGAHPRFISSSRVCIYSTKGLCPVSMTPPRQEHPHKT